jgi:hypothetical protein
MDQLEPDMGELASATADVHIRFPVTERLIYTAVAVAFPVAVTSCAVMSGVPLLHGVIGSAVFEVFLLPFVIIAYRFEVRADSHEIFHREIVTRRIPLEHVERIRVAYEAQLALGWPVKRTKIEVLGNGTRILVGWRRSRMVPLLRFLEQQFSHEVEYTGSLPDA